MEKTQVEQSSANHVFPMHMALILLPIFANRCVWYYVPAYVILICGQTLPMGLIKHHAVKTYRVGRTYLSKCSCTRTSWGIFVSFTARSQYYRIEALDKHWICVLLGLRAAWNPWRRETFPDHPGNASPHFLEAEL